MEDILIIIIKKMFSTAERLLLYANQLGVLLFSCYLCWKAVSIYMRFMKQDGFQELKVTLCLIIFSCPHWIIREFMAAWIKIRF
jgi:hypothetical protein